MEQELKKDNLDKKKKDNSPEEQKKELAKTFGINLSDIEHVKLENGKEFFKFFNPETGTVKMVENRDHNTSLKENFESIQQELSYFQGKDDRKSAKDIYEHNMKHKNVELNLISLSELKNNKYKYKKQIDALSTIDRKKLITLLKFSTKLHITHINIENSIGINKDGTVIDLQYDYAKNKAIIKSASVYNNENELSISDEEIDYEVELSNIDFDKIVDELDIDESLNIPGNIIIANETITEEELRTAVKYPEAIEKVTATPKRKTIFQRLVDAVNRHLAKQNGQSKENNRQYVLTNNKKNNSDENRDAA